MKRPGPDLNIAPSLPDHAKRGSNIARSIQAAVQGFASPNGSSSFEDAAGIFCCAVLSDDPFFKPPPIWLKTLSCDMMLQVFVEG